MCDLKIEFPNKEILEEFMRFMDCFGEQTYWDWTDGKPSVSKFEYDYENLVIKGIE